MTNLQYHYVTTDYLHCGQRLGYVALILMYIDINDHVTTDRTQCVRRIH